MELILILALICGAIGYMLSTDENKTMGTTLGLLLGPLGVVAAAVMSNKETKED